jgi:hypothetical protein
MAGSGGLWQGGQGSAGRGMERLVKVRRSINLILTKGK